VHTAHGSGAARQPLGVLFGFLTLALFGPGLMLLFTPMQSVPLANADQPIMFLTRAVALIIPLMGTTAFVLMCAERAIGRWKTAANIDPLTDLPNRSRFNHASTQFFASAKSAGTPFALLVFDVDHFKSINDRYGHAVGDRALVHLAKILRRYIAAPHLVAALVGRSLWR
jgi:GGDEF domain-containing protein